MITPFFLNISFNDLCVKESTTHICINREDNKQLNMYAGLKMLFL